MMEQFQSSLVVVGRVVTILPLLLIITMFMGKRAIGQLPIIDFLIIISLGSVIGADIADPSVKHLPTAIAIIAIGLLQRIVASWKLSSRKFGRLVSFEPTVVIQNGKMIEKNLKKIRYSIDNILQMLREKDVFDISEVQIAMVEANGSLSVAKKASKNTVTLEDMRIINSSPTIAFPVIVEGEIYTDILKAFHVDEAWLQQQLYAKGIKDKKDVLFASINRERELHVSLKNESDVSMPPICH